jgi:hypothetical protein
MVTNTKPKSSKSTSWPSNKNFVINTERKAGSDEITTKRKRIYNYQMNLDSRPRSTSPAPDSSTLNRDPAEALIKTEQVENKPEAIVNIEKQPRKQLSASNPGLHRTTKPPPQRIAVSASCSPETRKRQRALKRSVTFILPTEQMRSLESPPVHEPTTHFGPLQSILLPPSYQDSVSDQVSTNTVPLPPSYTDSPDGDGMDNILLRAWNCRGCRVVIH